MVIYFKLDYYNRLWLLFCTSIKLKEMNLAIGSKRIRINSPIMISAEPMK